MANIGSATPQESFSQGTAILATVLVPKGFVFALGAVGSGSGGPFASGQFIRDLRRLELHYRTGLGSVTYRIGDDSMGHETYLRSLGKWKEHRYPGFSTEPMDAFHDLAHDLLMFCDDFLSGTGATFISLARTQAQNPIRVTGFAALGDT